MYKNELAKLAGVSSRTFRRYLATRRSILTAMGISPFARKLPPAAVRFISEDYCIDLPSSCLRRNISTTPTPPSCVPAVASEQSSSPVMRGLDLFPKPLSLSREGTLPPSNTYVYTTIQNYVCCNDMAFVQPQ